MQNTKLCLMDENENIVEKTEINFAPILKIFWDLKLSEERYPFLSTWEYLFKCPSGKKNNF